MKLEGSRKTQFCRRLAQVLVCLMVIEGFTFQMVSEPYHWSPGPIRNALEGLFASMNRGTAYAASFVDFASFEFKKKRIEDREDEDDDDRDEDKDRNKDKDRDKDRDKGKDRDKDKDGDEDDDDREAQFRDHLDLRGTVVLGSGSDIDPLTELVTLTIRGQGGTTVFTQTIYPGSFEQTKGGPRQRRFEFEGERQRNEAEVRIEERDEGVFTFRIKGEKLQFQCCLPATTITLVIGNDAGVFDCEANEQRPVNFPPVADAGPDQTVSEEEEVQLDGSGSTDLDGDPLTYEWKLAKKPAESRAVLSDPTAVQPSITVDKRGTYDLQLRVGDGTEESAPDGVIVTTENVAPVADAGPDQTRFPGQLVVLDGNGSSDVDNDPLTYQWSFVSRPPKSKAALDDRTSAGPTLTLDRPGTYVVELIVNDGTLDSEPDMVVVSTLNSRPVADAGSDRTEATGTTVTLDGSGSADVDGDGLTFMWALLFRPEGSTAALVDVTGERASFETDVVGTYVAQLIVNDGRIHSEPDTVVITAEERAPVADPGPNQLVTVGETVQLDGSSSTGGQVDDLAFAWSFVSRPQGSSATLSDPTVVNPTFFADLVGDYEVQLIVNDGQEDSAAEAVTISASRPEATITGFAPTSAATGELVTITGTNLAPLGGTAPQVRLAQQGGGTIEAPIASSNDTTIQVTVPPEAVTGALSVTVDGQMVTAADPLTIILVPPPEITSIFPSQGTSAGGTAVTISGSGFNSTTTVTIGGNPATEVVVVNDGFLTAATPAGTPSPPAADVVVTNDPGGSGTLAEGFFYSFPFRIPEALAMFRSGSTNLTVTLIEPAATELTLNFTSSFTTVATVPLSAVIPAGQRVATVPLTPVGEGETTMTVTLGAASGGTRLFVGDTDSDGDGLPDAVEPFFGTDPAVADTDGNGVLDGDEDFDNDGLSNAAELAAGTDPFTADTDGDGLLDGAELQAGTDPLNPDTDGDGFSDGAEVAAGSNPLVAASLPIDPTLSTGEAVGATFTVVNTTDPGGPAIGEAVGATFTVVNTTDPGGPAIGEAVGATFTVVNTTDPSGPAIGEAVGATFTVVNTTDPSGPAIGEAVGATFTVVNTTEPSGPAVGEAVGLTFTVENAATP